MRQLLACVHTAGGSCSTSCLTKPATSTCLGVVASARRRLAHPRIHGHLAGAGVGAPVQVLACGGGREGGKAPAEGPVGRAGGDQRAAAGGAVSSMHPHNQPPLLQPTDRRGRRCGPCGRCRSRPRRSWPGSRTRRGAGHRRRRERHCARPAWAARGRVGGREWRVCWPEVTAIDCMPATAGTPPAPAHPTQTDYPPERRGSRRRRWRRQRWIPCHRWRRRRAGQPSQRACRPQRGCRMARRACRPRRRREQW